MKKKFWIGAAAILAVLGGGHAVVADIIGGEAATLSSLLREMNTPREITPVQAVYHEPSVYDKAAETNEAYDKTLREQKVQEAAKAAKEAESRVPTVSDASDASAVSQNTEAMKASEILTGTNAESIAPVGEAKAKPEAKPEKSKKKKKGDAKSISPENPLTITADLMRFNSKSGEVRAVGKVDMKHMDERYRTEHVFGNHLTQHFVIPAPLTWTATGNVAKATRGEYDAKIGESTFENFEGWHKGLYFYRGTSGVYDHTTKVATVQNAYFTTKSAVARVPDYRIEADSIDIYPGDKYVAHHPSLFFKNTRVITLGSYTGSLKHNDISIWSIIPTPIYDSHNGFGFKNAFEMPIGGVESNVYFYTRLAWYTKQGFIPDVGIRYVTPQGTFRFRYAKVESTDNDNHIWLEKRPSLTFDSRAYFIKNTNWYVGYGGELGYWKQKNGPAGSYKKWEVYLRHTPITLGPHLTFNMGLGYVKDYYGYRNLIRKNAYYYLGLYGQYGIFSAWASYRNNNQVGWTPYSFDTFDMDKPVSLGYRVQLTKKDAFSVGYSIDTVNGILKHRDYTYYRDLHSFTAWVQYRSVDKEWRVMIQPKDFTF